MMSGRQQPASANPILPFLRAQPALILDGGLATELDAQGLDLADELWSANALLNDSDVVRRVHLDYLAAGADCVITATYQATEEGFQRRGLGAADARSLMVRAVALATEARDMFWRDVENRRGRRRPLVAASVGPYGAFLADGSEYTGDYGLTEDALAGFHRRRFAVLAAAGADLLACETIPSLPEVRALARLLAATPDIWTWFSFQCRDSGHLADGTPVTEAAAVLEGCDRVAAIGVNCTSPRFVADLAGTLARATSRPIVVYPNSGRYDPQTKKWSGETAPEELADVGEAAWQRGARLLGGCCHTGPDDIRALRRRLFTRRPVSEDLQRRIEAASSRSG